MSSDSGDDLVSAYFADALRAGDTVAVAGMADVGESAARLLIRMYEALEYGGCDEPEKHPEFVRTLRRAGSIEANRAVRDGDVTKMSAMKGVSSHKVNAADMHASEIMEDELFKPHDRDQMLNLIIYGPTPSIRGGSNTGAGKSSFGYSTAEAGIRAYASYGKTLTVGSNNDTDPFAQVEKWSEAEEWMQETDGPKLLILDEAAQGLMYSDMSAGKVLSLCIRLMRKYNCHLILIAHTGKDIPKDVRRQVVYARKEDKYGVKLGNKLDEDKSGELRIKNVEYELGEIPDTNIEYGSYDDKGEFEWDIDVEEDEEDPAPQCQAKTNSGDPCPNDAKHPESEPIVCVNHRHKLDEIEEG